MALKWMDGFEHTNSITNLLEGVGGAAAWSQVGAWWSISSANPATGTYHMRTTEGSAGYYSPSLRRALGASKQVTALGYRFNVGDLPSAEEPTGRRLQMLGFNNVSNAEQVRVQMGTEGSVAAYRGSTLLGRSDPVIAAGGYHHFEGKSKIDNTTGYIEVRINEVTVLNLTGIDTLNSGSAETSQFLIGHETTPGNAGFTTYDVDDCFAWDDDASDSENTVVDWVGDKGCYFLRPNADTATSDWTINGSATAYGALDEVPPSGTDYLDTASSTARTIVGVESLPGNVSEVIAFMPVIYARKEESGTVNLRGGVVVGTDESYTPTNSPSTEYAYMEPGCKTIDPSTGVAWANDAEPELLIERTA